MPLMGDKEWELAQEMLQRYEHASEQNLEAARRMEEAAQELGNHVDNFGSHVRRLKNYS